MTIYDSRFAIYYWTAAPGLSDDPDLQIANRN